MTVSTETSVQRRGLCLEPLDTLFFRDGRPFDAGSHLRSGTPRPQTLAGAVRTFLLTELGCDWKRLGNAVQKGASFVDALSDGQPEDAVLVAGLRCAGPWFCREGSIVVSMPANLMKTREGEEIVRIDPLDPSATLPGWVPPRPGMRPLWSRDLRPAKRLTGFLTLEGLHKYLEGRLPSVEDVVEAAQLFGHDRRIGIKLDPATLATLEGFIYSVALLAPVPGVTLYAEVEGPTRLLERLPTEPRPLPLGGEGRRVALSATEVIDWPKPKRGGRRRLLLLTAPGIFADGWCPANLDPVAAAVPGYEAVSGWDMARNGPKPTRFAAAAGSVYFLECEEDSVPSTLCDAEDDVLGWGHYVEGVWEYV